MSKLAAAMPQSVRGWVRKVRFAWRNARFHPYTVRKSLDGVAFEFLIGDIDGQEWYAGVERLSPEMIFLRDSLVRPGDVVLDCGAHHGFLTILLAGWAGAGGRVVAFEASPSSARILRENVARNGLEDRVTVEAKAVGAAAGTLRMSEESNAIALTGRRPAGVAVPVVPLDDYAALRPTLIKLDVEGFEIEVLRGARQVLEGVPKLAIEVHVEMIHRRGQRAQELLELLRPGAYELWLQAGAAEIPRPYRAENLDELSMNQLHLYALPKAAAKTSA